MKEKQKIYLGLIGLSLVICTITTAAGYFLAQAQGAIYGVAAGLIISGITAGSLYFVPPFFMVKLYGGRELLKIDSPEFIETIEEFARIVDIPVPRFYVSDNDIPLIFTVGRDRNSASIVLTHSFMNIMSSEELTCAIIHEMSRIKLDHIYRQTVVAFMAGLLTMFSTIAFFGMLFTGFGQEDDPAPRIVKFFTMGLVAPLAASLILLIIPVSREYSIDKTAIEICKVPRVYIRMLAKIGRHFLETRHERINPAHGLLNIVNPLPQGNDIDNLFYRFFKTHPGLDERIETIQAEWTADRQTVAKERITDKDDGKQWKKGLMYSIIPHLVILFGIMIVYAFSVKEFKAEDSIIISGVYLALLVITYIVMYMIFKNRLC